MLKLLLAKVKGDPRISLLKMMPEKSICAEIGVWKGAFSQRILKVAKPKKLHLIDPWLFQPEYPERWYGGSQAQGQTHMDGIYEAVVRSFGALKNVVIHRELSHVAAAQFHEGYFDWVYIDGNHSYEFVKSDLELYAKKVRQGGFIAGDDYYWGPLQGFPVKRAVDEFINSTGVIVIKVDRGQFILQMTEKEHLA